ncbi:MAG TPA: hypothetical protein VFT45_14270 [Longimicrobium sp.]|nr:hypothetical protein [Longimicrobium sp.]
MSAWPVKALWELAEVTTGVPVRVKDDAAPGSGTPVVSVGSLQEGGIAPVHTLPRFEPPLTDAERNRAVLQPGFVLLSARGAALRMALVGPEHDGALANHTVLIIRPFGEVGGAALYATLRLPGMVHQLEQMARESTATRAWRPVDVERLRVPVPPGPVQQMVEQLIRAEERHLAAARRALDLRREAVWTALGEALEGKVLP